MNPLSSGLAKVETLYGASVTADRVALRMTGRGRMTMTNMILPYSATYQSGKTIKVCACEGFKAQ